MRDGLFRARRLLWTLALCTAAFVLVTACVGVSAGQPIIPTNAGGGLPVGYGSTRGDWVGVWSGREPDLTGYSDAQTVLNADGTFTSLMSNIEFGSLVRIWGRWDVLNLTGTPFLRFAVEGHDPREWCGPLGCSPVTVPTGMTRYFTFLDRDTVMLRDEGCTSPACEVRYTR